MNSHLAGSEVSPLSIFAGVPTTGPALSLTHAVSQGSILGLILFLIFLNDLPCFLIHGRLLSHADDTQVLDLDSAPYNPHKLQELKSRAESNVKYL